MMYHNQNCEVIVLGYHIDKIKNTLWVYSPEDSAGRKFLATETGNRVASLFKAYVDLELSK